MTLNQGVAQKEREEDSFSIPPMIARIAYD
jgi:hypothetical protein